MGRGGHGFSSPRDQSSSFESGLRDTGVAGVHEQQDRFDSIRANECSGFRAPCANERPQGAVEPHLLHDRHARPNSTFSCGVRHSHSAPGRLIRCLFCVEPNAVWGGCPRRRPATFQSHWPRHLATPERVPTACLGIQLGHREATEDAGFFLWRSQCSLGACVHFLVVCSTRTRPAQQKGWGHWSGIKANSF